MMCGCNKHREDAAQAAEEKGYPRLARVIRRIPTHDERMAWLQRTAEAFELRNGRKPRRSM